MKLPCKALLFRDWKYSKWFIPLLIMELFVMYIIYNFIFFEKSFFPRLNLFQDINGILIPAFIITFTIILMAISLFYYDRKHTNYTLAASMPFKRDEIITSKWCVGLYTIFVSFFVIYILMNALLITNFCWSLFFFDITKWFILFLSFSLCVFGFVMVIQSLSGSSIIGSIMTFLFAAFPFSLFYSFYGVFIIHYREVNAPRSISKFLKLPFMQTLFLSAGNPQIDIGFGKAIILSIGFLILTLALYLISLQFYKKIRFEKIGCITMLSSFEKFYRAILSYYAGFFTLILLSLTFQKYAFRPDIVILCCVILPIPFYFVSGKAFKLYSKRFA